MRVRASAAALACVVAAGLWLATGGGASAGPSQFPTTTVAPFPGTPTTAPGGILVPGATTTAPPVTAGGVPTTAAQQVEEQEDSQDSSAGRTVWMAIIGLVVVAVLILTLTILYARHTRPSRWQSAEGDEDDDEGPFTPTAARSVFGDGTHDEQTFWWAED